jgi:cytoskeleton protein RodZ
MSQSSTDGGAGAKGIGARLQAARERAGLSLIQAARHLHVDPAVVQALESENFGELGPAVYARGHLRHYAELLRESVPELLALYSGSTHAGPPPDLTLMPHAKQNSSWRGALLLTGLALVIGVGLIGSIRWIYLDLHPVASVAPASKPRVPATGVPTTDARDPRRYHATGFAGLHVLSGEIL